MNWATIKPYIWDWPITKEKMERTMFATGLFFFFVLNILDIWTTYGAVARYGIEVEQNPIARYLFDNAVLFIGLKMGWTIFLMWWATRIKRWSSLIAHTLVGVGVGMMAITVASNYLIMIQ